MQELVLGVSRCVELGQSPENGVRAEDKIQSELRSTSACMSCDRASQTGPWLGHRHPLRGHVEHGTVKF